MVIVKAVDLKLERLPECKLLKAVVNFDWIVDRE